LIRRSAFFTECLSIPEKNKINPSLSGKIESFLRDSSRFNERSDAETLSGFCSPVASVFYSKNEFWFKKRLQISVILTKKFRGKFPFFRLPLT
jgi:hypothetical protein